ncbi:MAG: sugar-binding transcriptional regulator, partial [Actinobacteria bacterium]|nr:sugar-binding transcriptional regulator [Actinomycetota bacterium]
KEIFKLSSRVRFAMVGMSDIGPESTLVKIGSLSLQDSQYLKSLGVVGDVNLIFVDKDGKHVPNKVDERIITLSLEKLKKIENVIGVGFGKRKIEVIFASLRGKIIDILVTDEATAKDILNLMERL